MPRSVEAIARELVNVVDQAGCVVTFVHVEKKVRGFRETDPCAPSWNYEVGEEEHVLWSGMTSSGTRALGKVLREGLVALCPLPFIIYLLEGEYPPESSWMPFGLAPAHMANVRANGWLLYLRDPALTQAMMRKVQQEGDAANWKFLEAA